MYDDLDTRMDSTLCLARRSAGTRREYLRWARQFLAFTGDKPEAELCEDDVRAWLHHLVEEREVGATTQKMATAAVKFLFARVLGRPEELAGIPMPKIPEPLPVVLSHEDLLALFDNEPVLLKRTAMVCAYGAGLRVSEVCELQTSDLDAERGILHVRHGKGDKARITALTQTLLAQLPMPYVYTVGSPLYNAPQDFGLHRLGPTFEVVDGPSWEEHVERRERRFKYISKEVVGELWI